VLLYEAPRVVERGNRHLIGSDVGRNAVKLRQFYYRGVDRRVTQVSGMRTQRLSV
jgi:hypothetical protein